MRSGIFNFCFSFFVVVVIVDFICTVAQNCKHVSFVGFGSISSFICPHPQRVFIDMRIGMFDAYDNESAGVRVRAQILIHARQNHTPQLINIPPKFTQFR